MGKEPGGGAPAAKPWCAKVCRWIQLRRSLVHQPTCIAVRQLKVPTRSCTRASARCPHTLCFAVKSNGNLNDPAASCQDGKGFDIVSGGELHHLQRIGVRGDRIVFSGVGKDRHEIREALNYRVRGQGGRSGILLFNAESEAELDILMEESARLAGRSGNPPAAAIR